MLLPLVVERERDVFERLAVDADPFSFADELDPLRFAREEAFRLLELAASAREVVARGLRLAVAPRRTPRVPPDIWSRRRSSSSTRVCRTSIVLVRRWSSSIRARIVFATPSRRSAPGASPSL